LCDGTCVYVLFGEKLASEYNIKFLETSAKSSINVEEAFITLSRDIKTKIDKKAVSPRLYLSLSNFRSYGSLRVMLLYGIYKPADKTRTLYVYTLVWQFFSGEIVLFSQFNQVVCFWQLFWRTFGG